MSGVNKAIIVGRLGRDPEANYLPSGDMVVNASVATSESWTDKNTGEKNERTEWHRIVFFRRLAEVAAEYLKKGDQIYMEGKIQTRKWTDKEGNDRYSTEIVAQTLQMLGGSSADNGRQAGPATDGGNNQKPVPSNRPLPAAPGDYDDDIPF